MIEDVDPNDPKKNFKLLKKIIQEKRKEREFEESLSKYTEVGKNQTIFREAKELVYLMKEIKKRRSSTPNVSLEEDILKVDL